MKKQHFIILLVLIGCFVWVKGAWAETKGYKDSSQNTVTNHGVVGAVYNGNSGIGVSAVGLFGKAESPDGSPNYSYFGSDGDGVMGVASSKSGGTNGGAFYSESVDGTGVHGIANAQEGGRGAGGCFHSYGTSGIGVRGTAEAFTGETIGGDFIANSEKGIGVKGEAGVSWLEGGGVTYGGYFISNTISGKGVYGEASATSGTTYGGYFKSKSSGGRGIYGLALANSGNTIGGAFETASTTGRGTYGLASSKTGVNYGVYGESKSSSGYGVYSKGNMKVDGKLNVSGPIIQKGKKIHADYVFDKNYKLESIAEHSNFMWENKHLKAVPKAKIDKDGLETVEYGAHQRGIVEELEKAHIYIEQLNAKNKELEDRISKLEALLENKTQ